MKNTKGIKKRNSSKLPQSGVNIDSEVEKLRGIAGNKSMEIRQVEIEEVCDVCGHRGFDIALMYCSMCSDTAVHQYCLGIPPGSIDDTYHWLCEYCSPSMESGHQQSSFEESLKDPRLSFELETEQDENAILMIEEDVEPLCILPPLVHRDNCEHPCRNTYSTFISHLLDSKEKPEPYFGNGSLYQIDEDISGNGPMSLYQPLSDSLDRVESEASVSSLMECPKEIMSGLVLLVSLSGDIVIQGDTSFCSWLAPAIVNMANSCNGMNSNKSANDLSLYKMKLHLASYLDEPVGIFGEVAYECVDQERVELGGCSLGTDKDVDAVHAVDTCQKNGGEDADSRGIKRKRESTQVKFDLLPPLRPECKRIRSKRYKISSSWNKEGGALIAVDVPSIGKEGSSKVVMLRNTCHGIGQAETSVNIDSLTRDGLQVKAIYKNCGLYSGMVDTCGNNAKERCAQVDDGLCDQDQTRHNHHHHATPPPSTQLYTTTTMSQRPDKEVVEAVPKKRKRQTNARVAAPTATSPLVRDVGGYGRGAGKSVPPDLLFPGNFDDSGSRHVHSRNVTASVRERGHSITIRPSTAPSVQKESFVYGGDQSLNVEDVDDQNFGDGFEGSAEPAMWVAPKRKDGKFAHATQPACSTDSRRRSKKKDDAWLVKEPVPGGPATASVIPSFNGHVAMMLWSGIEDRGVLKCHSRLKTCRTLEDWRKSMTVDASNRLHRSWLSHLSMSMLAHIDAPLISPFVERWQPDTNSFHLPFGEMTIMLHDVWYILKIPVDGNPVSDDSSINDLKGHVAELFGMPVSGLQSDGESHWAGGGVTIDSILHFCRRKQPSRCEETQLTAWLFLLLGCTLFIDKSENKVRPRDIFEALVPDDIHRFSWGSATLAYLYRQLGTASRYGCLGIAGCLTLLQSWIYEYFPCFRPYRERNMIESEYPRAMLWNVRSEDKSAARLTFIRKRLDSLHASEIDWMPYQTDVTKDVPRTLMVGGIRYRDIIEPYMPDRALRQLGRVQVVPMKIIAPESAMRPGQNVTKYEVNHSSSFADWVWLNFPYSSSVNLRNYEVAMDPSRCTDDYMLWYTHHSHPRLLRELARGGAEADGCRERNSLVSG